MAIFKQSKLNARRLLLENPWAHIEQLEEASSFELTETEQTSASRRKFQNQYAHLDSEGGFTAVQFSSSGRSASISFEEIEKLAIEMQRNLWRARDRLWRNGLPQNPVAMLDPSKASQLLGYNFEVVDTLGVYSDRPGKISVAGEIDRRNKVIRVSRDFEPSVQVFTAAHELGHLVLHPELNNLHRDRGLSGIGVARDRVELEADKFAVFFLLPEKLVRKEFERRFLASEFSLSEETGFALLGKSPYEFGKLFSNRRNLSRRLASATNYNGQNFYSLAECFGVTVETMAIRLEELGAL